MASTRRMVLLGGAGAAGALVVGYALWPSQRLEGRRAGAAWRALHQQSIGSAPTTPSCRCRVT
jgi:hypothetical protein